MLSKVTNQFTARQLVKSVRCFGSNAGPYYRTKDDNGLQDPLVQQNKTAEAHHGHVHAAGLDHKFIESGANKKTLDFDNMRAS